MCFIGLSIKATTNACSVGVLTTKDLNTRSTMKKFTFVTLATNHFSMENVQGIWQR